MRAHLLVLMVALLLLPATAAQPAPEDATAPPVTFEDVTIDGLVVPLEETPSVEVPIAVGCEAGEAPSTVTTANVSADAQVEGVSVIVSPTQLAWSHQPGDCPSPGGTPYQGAVTVSIQVDQRVPAFDPVTVPLSMTVTKDPAPPTSGDESLYGPYTANLTFTPGYFNLYNLRMDEKVTQVGTGETARFAGTIEDHSNSPTRFTFTPLDVPSGIEVDVEPANTTLTPTSEQAFTVSVHQTGATAGLDRRTVTVQLEVTSASAERPEHAGKTSQVSVLTQFRLLSEDNVPGPGPGLTALGLLAAGLIARRGYGRSGR